MNGKHNRPFARVAALLTTVLVPIGAPYAQEGPIGQVERILDENGINFSADSFTPLPTIRESAVSIGMPDHGGIEFNRTLSFNLGGTGSWEWSSNFNYKVNNVIETDLSGFYIRDAYYGVTGGNWRDDFDGSSGPTNARLGSGATLVEDSTKFTYTTHDGTIVIFEKRGAAQDDYGSYGDAVGEVGTSIVKPNGEKITITYYEIFSGGSTVLRRRISSVQSNFGYQIKFEYATNVRTTSNNREWHRLIKAISINNGVDYCSPTAFSCTGFTQSWPQATYTSTGTSTVVNTSTDAGGVVRSYTFTGEQWYDGWRRVNLISVSRGSPATTVANFNLNIPSGGSTVTTANGTSTYTVTGWDIDEYGTRYRDQILQRTDPQSGMRSTLIRPYSGKPLNIVDELNRTWNFQYDANDRLIYSIPPEGTVSGTNPPTAGYTQNTYDSRGNITQVTQVKKSGSPLADIVTTAGYSGTCTNPKTCNQPIWKKDANDKQTDYTYDSTHGGILTEMKPAVTIGTPGSTVSARPLTVTTWTQRYAWVKNASGQLVQHPDPVWLISTVTECQGAPGSNTPVCDNSQPQTVTTYEYGASGTHESLLVKGVAVASGGVTLRTCYGYNVFHRRISETKPNANLSTCP